MKESAFDRWLTTDPANQPDPIEDEVEVDMPDPCDECDFVGMHGDGCSQQAWWRKEGYLAGKEIGGGLWVCVAPMVFTFRLMVCTDDYVHDFYCYPALADAMAAFEDWDGKGEPRPGWVKHFNRGGEERRR